eukprot:1376970-Rhodomonas_salina.1
MNILRRICTETSTRHCEYCAGCRVVRGVRYRAGVSCTVRCTARLSFSTGCALLSTELSSPCYRTRAVRSERVQRGGCVVLRSGVGRAGASGGG